MIFSIGMGFFILGLVTGIVVERTALRMAEKVARKNRVEFVRSEPGELDWIEQHRFWSEKAHRAFIRAEHAYNMGDDEEWEREKAQFELYQKRSQECIPESVIEEVKEAELRQVEEAFAEKEEFDRF